MPNLSLLKTRPELVGDDFVNWDQVQPGNQSVPVHQNDTFSSRSGLVTCTIERPVNLRKELQGSAGSTANWQGNFNPGDGVLVTDVTSNRKLRINFNPPIRGVGAQIQSTKIGSIGIKFTASIKAFQDNGTVQGKQIGSRTRIGTSNSKNDNSAIFVGLVDATATISWIEFDVIAVPKNFAINGLEILTA